MPNRANELTADVRWPRRLLIETALAIACVLLAVLSSFVPDWIEQLFGFSPDEGSGELEWGIVAAFAVAAVAFGWFARVDWRRWKGSTALLQRR